MLRTCSSYWLPLFTLHGHEKGREGRDEPMSPPPYINLSRRVCLTFLDCLLLKAHICTFPSELCAPSLLLFSTHHERTCYVFHAYAVDTLKTARATQYWVPMPTPSRTRQFLPDQHAPWPLPHQHMQRRGVLESSPLPSI